MHFNSSSLVDRPKETQSNRFPKPQYILSTQITASASPAIPFNNKTTLSPVDGVWSTNDGEIARPGQTSLQSSCVQRYLLLLLLLYTEIQWASPSSPSTLVVMLIAMYFYLFLFHACRWMDGRRLGLSSSTHKHIDRQNYAAIVRGNDTQRGMDTEIDPQSETRCLIW